MAGTFYDVLKVLNKYIGQDDAHKRVINYLVSQKIKADMEDAWCTEFIMAVLKEAGCIDLIGGYSQISGSVKKKAIAKGIYHSGSSGIMPGDIVLYGKNGKTNHSELAIGASMNVSGNYTLNGHNGVYYRKRSGRTIIGYVRPKYKPMSDFNNLDDAIFSSFVILNFYASGQTRSNIMPFVFGKNADRIQEEVERIFHDQEKVIFNLAVFTISGFASKDPYRKTILGVYRDSVQNKIDYIYGLRNKPIDEAAKLVLDNEFGTNEVRKSLLEFCGYNALDVQNKVNEILKQKPKDEPKLVGRMINLFRDAGRANEDVDGLQGNCIIFKSENHSIVYDGYKSGAIDKIKSEISGTENNCIVVSHPHSDHLSSNLNSLVKSKLIKKVYVPARDDGWESKYKERYDKFLKDCKSSNVSVEVLYQGSVFYWGNIKVNVVFQQDSKTTDSVNMKSLIILVSFPGDGNDILLPADHYISSKESKFTYDKKVKVYCSSHHGLKLGKYSGDKLSFVNKINPDYVLHTGWKSWPLKSIGQDPKTKQTDDVYQQCSNLIPSDVCGRTELKFMSDGQVDVVCEQGAIGKSIEYKLNGVVYNKVVHVCEKTKFKKVPSMIPAGAEFI